MLAKITKSCNPTFALMLRNKIMNNKQYVQLNMKYTTCPNSQLIHSNTLLYIGKYNFVNIPISSKYYHYELPTTLQAAMKLAQKQEKLNQKCYLLQYIAQLVDKDPKLYKYDLQKFMIKQLYKWKGGQGRMQRLATIAWVIRKLKLIPKLEDLYDQILRRMEDDQWFVNFDESVKALQAYAAYENTELKQQVMAKIQRNLGITIDDVGMTYYQRICNSLMEADRYDSPLWDKVQKHVIRNLSMDYTPRTFFDIFKAFAITRNGSVLFYQMCQSVIHKGHLYNLTHKIRNNLGDFDSTGDYFALMIQTYAIVNKYTPIPISPDFLDYLYKSLLASRVEYHNISSLTKLLKYMPQLQFHPKQVQNIIMDAINNKQFTNYHSFQDVQQLYFVFQSKLGHIPNKLRGQVQKLIQKDIDRQLLALPMAIRLVQFVLRYREDKDMNENGLIDSLNTCIEKKYKYLDPLQAKLVRQALGHNKLIQEKVSASLLLPMPRNKTIIPLQD